MLTPEEVKKAYTTAPQHLKEYIDSDELFNAFHEIREAHKLHIDHAGNLALAIDAVILGIKPFTELPALLKDGLQGLDDAAREKIIKDVNDTVFVPLRALTKKRAEESIQKTQEPLPQQSVVRAVEMKLEKDPPRQVAPVMQSAVLQKEAPQQQTSVVEQKLPPLAAPTQVLPPPQATPQQKQPEPPKYHGTDPYREPVE